MSLPRMPTESDEQKIVAEYLNFKKVFWFHPVNEGKRSWGMGKRLRSEGMMAGVPDIIIMQEIPLVKEARGAMIEMKRKKGGVVTPQQNLFMKNAMDNGWIVIVARGADDAIAFLKSIGF